MLEGARAGSVLSKFIIGLACGLSLYTLWILSGVALSWLARRTRTRLGRVPDDATIAILHTVCDDFCAEACETLLRQERVKCDVYVLDDSTLQSERVRIDEWAATMSNPVHVVRRETRAGFKAGNLNHWLESVGKQSAYRYVLLMDADGRLPPLAAWTLAQHLEGTGYAFAQACHSGREVAVSYFQRALHLLVECRTLHILPARNLIGLPTMGGHGVLIRTDAVKAVGGFPNLVSEDMAFTALLAMEGRIGVVAHRVMATDDVPLDYRSYWRRRLRWVSGDAALISQLLWRFWLSRIALHRKIDFSLRELRYPAASLYWLLLVLVSSRALLAPSRTTPMPAWSWLLLLAFLGPWLPALMSKGRSLGARLAFVASSTFVSAGLVAVHPTATIQGVAGRIVFYPTGGRAPLERSMPGIFLAVEVSSGVLFAAAGFLSRNMGLVALGVACLTAPVMRLRPMQGVTLRVGAAMFWMLIAFQIGSDVWRGVSDVEHLLVLLGLPMLY